MDLFNSLIKEISTKHNFLNISIIEEINSIIKTKLMNLYDEFKNTHNKYLFVSKLVIFGYSLEKSISSDSNIILTQLKNISGLFIPIINRIKKICYKLNLELIDDVKKNILEQIDVENSKFNKLDKLDIKKYIKYLNIQSFFKNTNIENQLKFDDFGIMVKITNPYHKNIFTNLIENIGVFTIDTSGSKIFDWFWKPLYNYNFEQITNNDYLNIFEDPNIIYSNSDEKLENKKNEKIEEFKIIQKIPNLKNKIIDNQWLENKFIQNDQILKKQTITNSIIIEDESFTIPINGENT